MPPRLGSLNEFCWMDLKTRDLPGTAAFFAEALGWRFAVDEEDWRKATKVATGGHFIGGVSDLANPVYPSGTPAHVAYYLAVDDVDRRTEAATKLGARVVVAPFDAGDQGRMATLVDPMGAAVSLWQPCRFTGWTFPPHLAGAPHRMVLTCDQPDEARHFYRQAMGTPPECADFVAADGSGPAVPRWELAVGVEEPHHVAGRARDQGRDASTWFDEAGHPVARISSPEGLTFQVRRVRT
ncbi:VOC family protein [Streptomyces muensis]|uniref:VOC family protein n=1 Tax=Streptomyces muensis TaxID=1077944 RepID=A0A9X1PV10_STRM4|nr:VOC family protein [Streptomyces muensis]MCF1592203.1 VOC family protein [Streptomyces muensis]